MIPRPEATTDLSGTWQFAWLGAATDLDEPLARILAGSTFNQTTAVPGCFDVLPELAGARGTAAYRRVLPTGRDTAGARLLRFDGLGIWARVYLNDQAIHTQRKPYSPFEIELPADARGDLTVLVDNRFSATRSPLQENYFDFYAYGGIFRPVTITDVPAKYIRRIEVVTQSVDPPSVSVRVIPSEPIRSTLGITVNGTVRLSEEKIDVPEAGTEYTLDLPGLDLWSPDDPVLHEIEVRLGEDTYRTRVGLRTFAVTDGSFMLNGSRIRLQGWNRHDGHPQVGPALPITMMEQDIRLMRAAGANFVRGSHYPQDERFLDLCDEHGMLVWEESIGWQQDARHFANDDYQQLIREQQREMIQAHINHPAIIMWGFQNELHSENEAARPVIEALARVTRESDPTRPVTFATCRFPHDQCLDLVDIISINLYPGWYANDQEEYRPLHEIATRIAEVQAALQEQGQAGKPLILSEIGAGAIYGWRDPHRGHWSEEYQEEYLTEVCRQFIDRDEIDGLALWQFCDCRTYGSGRALTRPRGFNNKGIVDEYRRPKAAYWAVANLLSRNDK